MSGSHDLPLTSVPESLLGPLLDAAIEALGELEEEDAPASLRPLMRFDRRGLHRTAARHQLVRALGSDEAFTKETLARFLDRGEVGSLLDGWDGTAVVATVERLAEQGDLPLLACTLLAGQPDGWPFALGVTAGVFDHMRRSGEEAADADALHTRIATLEEGLRRAEAAQRDAEERCERSEEELREERRSRRAREAALESDVESAERRLDAAEAALARAQAAADAAEERRQRERERVRAIEADAHDARGRVSELGEELHEARRRLEETPVGGTGLRPGDLRALAEAADLARRLADGLAGVVGEARRRGLPATHVPERPAPPPERPSAPMRREQVRVPAGMHFDTPEAVRSMVSTPGVAVIVDGYNIAKLAWPDATPAEQRDRLVALLGELHGRARCEVTVVFDGADVHAPPRRRPGVRVRFSTEGREADDVVIEEVAALPKRVPALVVSSDGWVREHAEAEGARVIRSATLLAAMRR